MLQELGLLSSHSMPCFPEKWNDRSSLWQTFGESVPKSDVKKRQEKREHSNQQRERERERERWKDRTDKMEFTIQKSNIISDCTPERSPTIELPFYSFSLFIIRSSYTHRIWCGMTLKRNTVSQQMSSTRGQFIGKIVERHTFSACPRRANHDHGGN